LGLREETMVQTLSVALQLPVSLYKDGRCALSLPAEPACAALLLGKAGTLEGLTHSHVRPGAPQFLQSF
jgi:hypothetical protein